jgi:hypothetical protein
MKEHGKEYNSLSEYMLRREVFHYNKEKIETHNAKGTSTTMGLNAFADMTSDEFKQHYATCRPSVMHKSPGPSLGKSPLKRKSRDDLPPKVDWTNKDNPGSAKTNGGAVAVTKVKNQGQCGSCWSFAVGGAIEGHWFLHGENGGMTSPQSISEQQLIECDDTDAGCHGGLMDNGFAYEEHIEICKDEEWPYIAKVPAKHKKCARHTCSAIPAGGIKGFMDVTSSESSNEDLEHAEEDLMHALTLGPVSVAIQADQFGFQSYTGGILTNKECLKKDQDKPELDHGVTLVGYGTDEETGKDYWIIRNSWGEWGSDHKGNSGEEVDGEKGYILFERGPSSAVNGVHYGTCGVHMSASYPCVKGGSQDGCKPAPPDDDDDDVPTGDFPCSQQGCYEQPDKSQGCHDGELGIQIQGIAGNVCAPQCNAKNECPKEVPQDTTATPTCALQDNQGGKYCVLMCDSDSMCPKLASCKKISGTGICTYDGDTSQNAMSVDFIRDVVNAVNTNNDVFETETIFQ